MTSPHHHISASATSSLPHGPSWHLNSFPPRLQSPLPSPSPLIYWIVRFSHPAPHHWECSRALIFILVIYPRSAGEPINNVCLLSFLLLLPLAWVCAGYLGVELPSPPLVPPRLKPLRHVVVQQHPHLTAGLGMASSSLR